MIGVAIKGRGFRGLLGYLAGKPGARLLGGDMAGTTPRALAREFGQVRERRPKLGRAVFHLPLRPAPGETLTDEQWMAVVQRVLVATGYGNSPYVVYLHSDTDPHVHIVSSRVDYDGRVVSDSNDYFRVMEVLREVERDYGLRVVPSREAGRRPPGKGAYQLLERTGEASVRERLQRAIAEASAGRPTMTVFLGRLRERGIDALPNVASTGRVTGISYLSVGYTFKGSTLGRDYSWRGLRDRLEVRFDPDQDLAAVLAARAQALAHAQAGSRSDAAATVSDRLERPATSDLASAALGRSAAPSSPAATSPGSAPSPPAPSATLPGSSVPAAAGETAGQRRALAELTRHLEALGASRYHVLVLDPARGRRELRAGWTAEQVARALPWLRAENAQGAEILVRPSDPSRFTVLSGVASEALERARSDGFVPAVAVRVGDRHEVWMRHDRALAGEKRALVTARLAGHFDVDPRRAPADYGHLGGFASHVARRESGAERPVYAAVASTSPGPFPRATELEDRAARQVEERRQGEIARAEARRFDQAAPAETSPAGALARAREAVERHEAALALARAAPGPEAARREDDAAASARELARAHADLARLAGRWDLPRVLSRADLELYLSLRDRLAVAERRVLAREEARLASPGPRAAASLREAESGRQALHRELVAFERAHGLSPSTHVVPGFLATQETPAFRLTSAGGTSLGEPIRLESRAQELRFQAGRLEVAVDALAVRLGRVERLALERPDPATLEAFSRLMGDLGREERRLEATLGELRGAEAALRRHGLERVERSLLASPSAGRLQEYVRAASEVARSQAPPPAIQPSRPDLPASRPGSQHREPATELRDAARRFLEEPTRDRLLTVRSALYESASSQARARVAGIGRELAAARGELRAVNRELLGMRDPSPDLRERWSQALARYNATADRWAAAREAVPISPDASRNLLARVARGDVRPETVATLRRVVAQDLATLTGECPRPRPDPPAAATYREAVQAERRARAALLREARAVKAVPPSPASLARLETRIAIYQSAAGDVARKAARMSKALSPRAFLDRPAFRDRPERALAAWASHAARRGVSAERIGATLAHHGSRSRYAVPRALTGTVTYTLGWAARWAAASALRQVPGVTVMRRLRSAAAHIPSQSPSLSGLVVHAGVTAYSAALRRVTSLLRTP